MYKIASSTLRNSVPRGRPKRLAGGICGSINAHSASVRSLAERCPSRSYFWRVILLHILCLDDCFPTTIMPQPAEITQFIFGQPLSPGARRRDDAVGGVGAGCALPFCDGRYRRR